MTSAFGSSPQTPELPESLVEAESERRHDRRSVSGRMALQGLVEMLEAASRCDPVAGEERKLRGTVHQRLKSIEAVGCGDLADRVHPCVDVEGGEAGCAAAELGEALADLVPNWPELVPSHCLSPVEATVAPKG